AVAGEHQHAPFRLCEREAKPEHRRVAHRAPHRKVERRIARRRDVPGGGTKPRHHQQALSVSQKKFHDFPAVQRGFHREAWSWKLLMPMTACEISTATA